MLFLNAIFLNSGADKFIQAMETATAGTTDIIIGLVGKILCPIIAVAVGAYIVFVVVKAGFSVDKMRGQINEHGQQLILLAVVFLATTSFYSWITFFK